MVMCALPFNAYEYRIVSAFTRERSTGKIVYCGLYAIVDGWVNRNLDAHCRQPPWIRISRLSGFECLPFSRGCEEFASSSML